MKELLKLVKVEFQKLKRKKFILLVTLAAFMFPLPLAYLMTTPAKMEQYIDKADAFDGLLIWYWGMESNFYYPVLSE